MNDMEDLILEVRALNEQKGWREGSTTFAEYIALAHSELSEALDAWRSHKLGDPSQQLCERLRRHNPEEDHEHQCKPEGVGSEFADVFIRLLDMCDVFGIDLLEEYRRKMNYNWTRPFKHGGKVL